MAGIIDFARTLLIDGEVRLGECPTLEPSEIVPSLRLLEEAFNAHRLQIAGPLLSFEAKPALDALVWLAHACWYTIRVDLPFTPQRELAWPDMPTTPNVHLTIDVVLRFAVTLYRRAKLREGTDPLEQELERALRAWPLTGVLAGLTDATTPAPTFAGHRGLQLLYEERSQPTH